MLFVDAFTRLKIGGAILATTQTLLYVFAGECVGASRLICLPIPIGDGPDKVT